MDDHRHAEDILILHGTKDEVVPFVAAQRFSDANGIALIAVEGADHRFQDKKHMEFATRSVIEFFGF